eukprot:1669703-Prymnesium_polylepis.1
MDGCAGTWSLGCTPYLEYSCNKNPVSVTFVCAISIVCARVRQQAQARNPWLEKAWHMATQSESEGSKRRTSAFHTRCVH